MVSSCSELFSSLIPCELICNQKQVNSKKLNNKLIALYFGKNTCPPCLKFTPILNNFQQKFGIELIVVCKDKTEKDFDKFVNKFSNANFVPFNELVSSNLIENLTKKFNFKTVPHLVILDGNSKIISDNARNEIENSDTKEQEMLYSKWKYFNNYRDVM